MALCNIGDVKSLLSISDTSSDGMLSLLISGCSSAIEKHCGTTFAEVPDDIRLACAMWVSQRYHQNSAGVLSSEKMGEVTYSYRDVSAEGVPSNVVAMLRPYKRILVGAV